MKNFSGKLLVIALGAVLATASVFCAGAAADGAEHKDTIVWGQGADVTSFDPHQGKETPAVTVTCQIFDTLTAVDPATGEVKPQIAESWEQLDDTTYVFHIRKGIKFHNGSELTAADVKFSLDRAIASASVSYIVDFIKEVNVKDDFTVQVVLRAPYAPALRNLAVPFAAIVCKDVVEMASEILIVPGICLIATAVLLLIADHCKDGDKLPKNVTYTDAFSVGIAQGIATLPGLSRSGTTITACLLAGYQRNFAVKYSFLMSIPAILGALVLELKDATDLAVSGTEVVYYVIGMAVAAVVGYVCIKTMLVIVRKKKFTVFAIYCLLVGALSIGGYFYLA